MKMASHLREQLQAAGVGQADIGQDDLWTVQGRGPDRSGAVPADRAYLHSEGGPVDVGDQALADQFFIVNDHGFYHMLHPFGKSMDTVVPASGLLSMVKL